MTTRLLRTLLFFSLVLSAAPAVSRAANITLAGSFTTDDAVQRFNLTVAGAGSVDLRSYGYAGGTTSTGTVVPRGGFDTVLTLFSASGVFIDENDDGTGVATDPTTGLTGDARITANLTAGNYILTLTQYDNFSIGNLADGFVEQGKHTFTADPGFAPGGACAGNMFRDISGTDGRCRTGNWTVSFNNVASVTPVAPVPEPSALLLAGLGLGALLLMRTYRRRQRTKLLLGGAVVAIAAASSALAQDPDFSNTGDILRGQRTLLQKSDLQVAFYNNTNDATQAVVLYPIYTYNSQQQNLSSTTTLGESDRQKRLVTVSALMFNQPQAVTVTPLYNYQGTGLLTFCLRNIGPSHALITWQPLPVGQEPDINAIAVGDFNHDGFDELVFSTDSGEMFLVAPNDVNDPSKGFYTSSFALDVLREMTVGDFNGDGLQEIAGLANGPDGGLTLVIYSIQYADSTVAGNHGTFTITKGGSKVLATGGTAAVPVSSTSMARGQFNTTAHDQLAVTFATSSGRATVEIIDFAAGSLTPIEATSFAPWDATVPAGYIQVKTGKFGLPTKIYDQIVFHMSSVSQDGRFFQILSADETDLHLTAHSGILYLDRPCAAGIQVGNFDHQQSDPLKPGESTDDPNSQIAFLSCFGQSGVNPGFMLSIYNADPTTYNISASVNDNASFLPENDDQPLVFPAFVATDLQGRSMVLGEPTKITISSAKPSIILAAPPMHVDYITPVNGNKPVVLNISAIPSGFNSSFALDQNSKTSGGTKSKMSWSAGVDASVSGSYQVGDPDDGTGSRYSAGFHFADEFTGSSANGTVNYTGSEFQMKSTAETGDVVFFNDSRQNIWVYPVIGQTTCPKDCSGGQQPLTLQISGPDNVETGQTPASDTGAFWYQPPWEWGNVFSYPATKAQLALIFPDIADGTTFSNSVSFKPTTNPTSIQANWSAGQKQASSSSLSDTMSFDVSTSFVTSWGISKVAKGKFTADLKLSSSFGLAKLQDNSASVDASNGVSISSQAHFPETSSYGYNVTPYIFGNPPPVGVGDSTSPPKADIMTVGPLKTAFTADPTDLVNGGNWWNQTYAYSAAPDIALNHPSRWVVTKTAISSDLPSNCGNSGQGQSDVDCVDIAQYYDANGNPINPWTNDFLSMRGFFITRADNPGAGPQLGFANEKDQLSLAVRVYNYSLKPVSGNKVHVRFYAMPVNGSGTSLGDSSLIDEEVVDEIPPFDASKADLNWRLVKSQTPFDTTGQAGKFFAFWVVVWMEDANGKLVPEIQGHGLKSIPGTLTKPSDVPVEMATATDGTTTVSYSNNVGFYHYAFPVFASNAGLEAVAPENPDDITMKTVYSAKKLVKRGELDEITAVLRDEWNGPKRLKVYFFDGDPDAGGKPIATEIAWFQPRSITRVSIAYHPPTDGVHQIWAVINKGKPNQITRHTTPILVGNATADRNKSDGDVALNGKADQLR